MSLRDGIHSKYNLFESWFYDRFIAMGTHSQKVSVVSSGLRVLPEGARVLDIGCGGGQLIESLLAIRPDLQFVAIDNSSDQVKRAVSRLVGKSNRVEVREASVMKMPFADGEFDFVYSLASMKHWPDLQQGMREALRVLKPGGGILLTELDRQSSLEETRRFIGKWRIPGFLKVPLSGFYYRNVILQSLDVPTVLAVLRACQMLKGISHSRFPDAPAFIVQASKTEGVSNFTAGLP